MRSCSASAAWPSPPIAQLSTPRLRNPSRRIHPTAPTRGSKAEAGVEDQRRVEVKFCVERSLDVVGAAEAMPLALEQQVAGRNPAAPQCLDHRLGLIGRHDAIVRPLEE